MSDRGVKAQQIVRSAKAAYRLYSELGAALDNAPRSEERVSGSRAWAGAPRGQIVDARKAIKESVCSVAQAIIEAQKIALEENSMENLLSVIQDNANWLVENSEIHDLSDGLRHIAEAPELWYLAYREASDWVKAGACTLATEGARCGGDLYQNRDDRSVMCVLCGAVGSVEWWVASSTRKQIPLDAPAVAAYLTVSWQRPVAAALIRSWARSPQSTGISAMLADGQVESKKVGQLRGRCRVLYDLKAVLAHAERIWGPASVSFRSAANSREDAFRQ
ncbi:hypothetical protein [Micromonospora sp. WMMA1976]|uniref:hypothetical protein n=1 Tax=Micromonospora sp. WMMA1976 TaxID=3014995 RepID=UPI00248D20E7|nr:hypothetical protein [Micromonospora sp. WMMA1976]WBC04258.1 hypothetical protein O7546_04585 [Micromonospora sp. WMMA1976]